MRIVVGVSDIKVSDNPEDVIITHALGSCLGISVYDPVVGVGGLAHVMLPLSKADPKKAQARPEMFVDTGFSKLLKLIFERGATKKNLEINVAGGASMKQNAGEDYFKIGQRNFTIFRKLLWKNGFMIANQQVGGSISRTMELHVRNGLVLINKEALNHPKRLAGIEKVDKQAFEAVNVE